MGGTVVGSLSFSLLWALTIPAPQTESSPECVHEQGLVQAGCPSQATVSQGDQGARVQQALDEKETVTHAEQQMPVTPGLG